MQPQLKVALGDYPHTRAFKAAGASFAGCGVTFADIAPINRAFAPMVRELRFDLSEMAIMTFLQARAHGVPVVLLPMGVAARHQESALLCRRDDTSVHGPADLAGRTIAVRSYSQTTGVWLRGVLQEDFGLVPEAMRWLTFEDAHVAGVADPPFVTRAAAGADLLGLLRAGAADAIIVGNDKPDDADLRTVFPDVPAAERRFLARHGFVPVNHVMVAHASALRENAGAVLAFMSGLREAQARALTPAELAILPFGRGALQPMLDLAMQYAVNQQVMPSALSEAALWGDLPAAFSALG
jgi:4,5-dihydroxyphthalate decarboxylase